MTTNKDFKYFLNHDFSKYEGKWIAILNKRVIANGTLKQVLRKIKGKEPLLAKVPKKGIIFI